jgi:hypothetical protein
MATFNASTLPNVTPLPSWAQKYNGAPPPPPPPSTPSTPPKPYAPAAAPAAPAAAAPATLYNFLGVSQDADATTITKTYRQMAKIMHPDKGGNFKEFQKLQSAYTILNDPEKKEKYNAALRENNTEKLTKIHKVLAGGYRHKSRARKNRKSRKSRKTRRSRK